MNRWRFCLLILVVFMISKDLLYAPFPNGLRAFSQGLCLLLGLMWLLRGAASGVLARYWPVLAYMSVLLLATPFTKYPMFILLQIASLFSTVLFFISYHETQIIRDKVDQHDFVRYVVITYGAVVVGSLVLAKVQPGLAYRTFFAGTAVGQEIRFQGLFGNAGGMGQASGLLLGFSALSIRRLPVKLALIAAAVAALFLTGSRSFWIGAFIASSATLWLYFPKWRARATALVLVCTIVGVMFYALGQQIDKTWVARVTRSYSFNGLNGRGYLWDQAEKGIDASPWVGFGFTMGSTGMAENRLSGGAWTSDYVSDPSQLSRVTFHNGYVQSVMDSGFVGTFFYIATMVVALWRAIKYDEKKQHPAVLFALLFLCISNIGESVIYSGAMFPSLCFWACAVFALSLKASRFHQQTAAIDDPSQRGEIDDRSILTNLMR